MRTHTRLAQSTFHRHLSPVEQAAAQLVPQAVSIALSIRELIRQGYLFSAALLVTVWDEPAAVPGEAARLTEAALTVDWSRPKEEAACSHLQPAKSSRPTVK